MSGAPTQVTATGSWSSELLDLPPRPAQSEERPPMPLHLELLGPIGRGGMGEVWRARDLRLGAEVALKVLRPELASHPGLLARFQSEARLTAGLQHPGIVPVHELGQLPDGRLYYTMRLVQGLSLAEILSEDPGQWGLRRRVQVLLRVCEAVGFAHAHAVVHRDLKPDNIRVGRHGEVVVLDWGIARAMGESEELPGWSSASGLTRGPIGTPGYMAPEQVVGAPAGPPADVYALGRMLALIIERSPAEDRELPAALRAIAGRAQEPEPTSRYAHAEALAQVLADWLDGAQRRERALELVAAADEDEQSSARDLARVAELRAEATRLEAGLGTLAPVERREPAWACIEEAAELERRAELASVERIQRLHTALHHEPELREAHARLAAHARRQQARAEARGDEAAAAGWELQLRAHDRGEHADWLRGEGSFSLELPEGARTRIFRVRRQLRRLRLEDSGLSLCGPIRRRALPRGSWMLQVELEGHHPLWHPLLLHRLHHEDHGPADAPAEPLRLLPLGSLGPGEAQVSPGWTVVGSDAEAANPAPSGRVWVRGCVMERQPVTNAQYLAFLNELVQSGRAEEAWQHAPRERPALEGSEGTVLWAFDGQRYSLAPDPDGDLWEPDWPVIMVGWEQAQAYARWRAQQSGLPWRLPREDEWERGARGADGRCFPWGEHLDPTWACYRASHPAGRKPGPWPVGRPAADISPFGLWGMAGGVRQWCHNLWGADQGSYAEMPALRGGSWASHPQLCRSATRGWAGPSARSPFVGFRLARDLP